MEVIIDSKAVLVPIWNECRFLSKNNFFRSFRILGGKSTPALDFPKTRSEPQRFESYADSPFGRSLFMQRAPK